MLAAIVGAVHIFLFAAGALLVCAGLVFLLAARDFKEKYGPKDD